MSDSPLKITLPKQVDPRKFAQQGVELSGVIAVDQLLRLSQSLASSDSEVDVQLVFGLDDQREKTITGNFKAEVKLVCQRCLEPVSIEVVGDLSLAVVWDEERAKNLPGHLEPWILGEGQANLYDIIEEELLLNLPLVAYHDHLCIDESLLSSGEFVESEPVKNPFQVLEQLKGSPSSKKGH